MAPNLRRLLIHLMCFEFLEPEHSLPGVDQVIDYKGKISLRISGATSLEILF